jgi:hypothetical protein
MNMYLLSASFMSNLRNTCEKVKRSSAHAKLFHGVKPLQTAIQEDIILHAQAHSRSARERGEPLVKVWIFQPAFGPEVIRVGKDGRVIVHEGAPDGDDSLVKRHEEVRLVRGKPISPLQVR